MQCDECGRTLLKNEQRVCPYCGRVYGTNQATKVILGGLALIAAVFLWLFLRG